jgi:hypothetical protein
MVKWKMPPTIKILEALGAVADRRVKQKKGGLFWVNSSSGKKHYEVKYDPIANAITSNDNGSYWKGYLGYPGIAVLLTLKVLPFPVHLAAGLVGIKWKQINAHFQNNFEQTEKHVFEYLIERGFRDDDIRLAIDNIVATIVELGLNRLGPTASPPEGY